MRHGNIDLLGKISRVVILKVLEDTDSVQTGNAQIYFTVPSLLNGYKLTSAQVHVYTASSSGAVTVQVRNVTGSQDMLSTAITIDATEIDSVTATTPSVVDTDHDGVATADVIAIDVDTAGTGTKGLEVRLEFN